MNSLMQEIGDGNHRLRVGSRKSDLIERRKLSVFAEFDLLIPDPAAVTQVEFRDGFAVPCSKVIEAQCH